MYLQRKSLRRKTSTYLQRESHARSHTTECESFTKETRAQWVMQRETGAQRVPYSNSNRSTVGNALRNRKTFSHAKRNKGSLGHAERIRIVSHAPRNRSPVVGVTQRETEHSGSCLEKQQHSGSCKEKQHTERLTQRETGAQSVML